MNRLNGGQTGGTPWSSRFANILLNKPIRKAPSASCKFARISSLINAETAHKRATFSRQADECISCANTKDDSAQAAPQALQASPGSLP